jgi:hypothetical protein
MREQSTKKKWKEELIKWGKEAKTPSRKDTAAYQVAVITRHL